MKCLFYKEFKDDLWGNTRVGGGPGLLGSLLVTFLHGTCPQERFNLLIFGLVKEERWDFLKDSYIRHRISSVG